MIGLITGKILAKQPPEVLIEAGGIGYEVNMPMTSIYQLPEIGEITTVFTHFVVREDAQLLFGFADKQERIVFRELIKANGVGPKLALTILSGMSAAQLVQCVGFEDVTTLVKLPGVGKKTAERLVVELKDRLAKLNLTAADDAVLIPGTPSLDIGNTIVPVNDVREEALSALVALGYKPAQASKVIQSVYKDDLTSEQLIREALRSMV
ncbi:Holliday junction branch migration protein RuvA [Opacimonas viscosa]|uniref:Holliday junction branch migration complex subunit RuvA n=1 Tax=Opacimonas viscosa TaxID=2961944 RepID=A0AA42BP62_9ALTE|nr:Holliday junction branch migration protein RuvA [Opacimonas viscosa]MCP3428111.1 Holliday junction branch migration protein RuvA [Opacimonas viscosa]